MKLLSCEVLFVFGYRAVAVERKLSKVNFESVWANVEPLFHSLWDVFSFVASIFNCTFVV